jgi:transforming growth factor-beta-induced protein
MPLSWQQGKGRGMMGMMNARKGMMGWNMMRKMSGMMGNRAGKSGSYGRRLEGPTILDFLSSSDHLTTLSQVVKRSGLSDALSKLGPLTLFAPSNEAFEAVPDDTLQKLLVNDEFIPHLQDLLLHHIVANDGWTSDYLRDGQILHAVNEEPLFVFGSPLIINEAQVEDPDNGASNGIVHTLDGVLVPSWVGHSIADRVASDAELSTLLSAVLLAGLESDLEGGLWTLLAPTNEAFDHLPADSIEFLASDAGIDTLRRILLYHFIEGVYSSTEFRDGQQIATAEGGFVLVSIDHYLFFDDSTPVEVDILSNNGILHKINLVLDPDYNAR